MSTVLYLANQQIQVVTGVGGQKKITVQKAYSAQVPEGSIINGIVMDHESFVEFIKDFWKQNQLPNKDVTLVINSSKFVGKVIELPKLKPAKTAEFIDREFADIKNEEEDQIYGYIPLTGASENMRRIYAEGISTEFIKEYLEIFREIGIEVKEIYSGESSVINLTGMTLASKYQTFVLLIADNITLTTLLWVNGNFYHFNSIRCFNEQGTEEYAMEVARSVSQIIQFMMANQVEEKLETIRIAGIPDVDISLYQEGLYSQGINVEIQAYDSNELSADKVEVQRYIEAASGLVTSGKAQNFLQVYNGNKRKKNKEKEVNTGLLVVGGVFVVMLFATLGCFIFKVVKQTQLDKLEAEINSPYVLEQVQQYDALLERNSFLARQYSAIAEVDENLLTYPVCNNEIIKDIDDCAGNYATVTFESFQADAGLVTVTAKAENVDEINKFIREMNNCDIFNQIDYTGYSYDEQTKLWDIHVTCILTEAAGR
jgi:hypothetical protein